MWKEFKFQYSGCVTLFFGGDPSFFFNGTLTETVTELV